MVFIADRVTMIAPEHRFLAVSTPGSKTLAPAEYAAAVAYGRQFRIRPGDMPSFHANLAIGNLGLRSTRSGRDGIPRVSFADSPIRAVPARDSQAVEMPGDDLGRRPASN